VTNHLLSVLVAGGAAALASAGVEQPGAYLLIAVDGTWQQANEMFKVRALRSRASEMQVGCQARRRRHSLPPPPLLQRRVVSFTVRLRGSWKAQLLQYAFHSPVSTLQYATPRMCAGE